MGSKHIEKLWKGPCFFSSGPSASAGLAVFFKEGLCKNIKLVYNDKLGRLMVLDIHTDIGQLRLINIYASNIDKEKKIQFTNLANWCNDETIIMGDFNTALSIYDISINNTYRPDISRSALLNTMKNYNLVDIWRTTNPSERKFSRRQMVEGKLKQSRIDLCLVAARIIQKVSSVTYNSNPWSDHDTLNIHLSTNQPQKNGGVWCLNNSLLDDNLYRAKIK